MKHGDCLDLEVEEESSVLTSMGAVEIEAGEQVSFLSRGGVPPFRSATRPRRWAAAGGPLLQEEDTNEKSKAPAGRNSLA